MGWRACLAMVTGLAQASVAFQLPCAGALLAGFRIAALRPGVGWPGVVRARDAVSRGRGPSGRRPAHTVRLANAERT